MTAAIRQRTPLVAVACVAALALRPIGWTATVVTLAVGAVAVLTHAEAPRAQSRIVWLVVVLAGVSGFTIVRIHAPAPAWRTTAIGIGASVAAAVAEELFFRRLLYARLERWGVPAAIVATAALFALVHVPAYGVGAIPIDLAAGLVFGWQRWATGTWTAPAATHVLANLMMLR